MISYKLVTLNYDQTNFILFMWNNGTRKIIYDYYKLVIVMIIYQIGTLAYDQTYLQLFWGGRSQ